MISRKILLDISIRFGIPTNDPEIQNLEIYDHCGRIFWHQNLEAKIEVLKVVRTIL